jgi:hypothetical protein
MAKRKHQEGGATERLEVHVSPELLAEVSQEAALWGISVEELARASIAGSLVISRDEKDIFAHLAWLLKYVSRRLAAGSTAGPPAPKKEAQALLQPIARLAVKGDRVPLVQALQRVLDLARLLASVKGGTTAQQSVRREALLTARRAARVARRLLAGEQPRTDLLHELGGELSYLEDSLGPLPREEAHGGRDPG